MKRNLKDMMDEYTPEELDALLGEDWQEELPEEADMDRLRRRALKAAGLQRPVRRMNWKRWTAVAAAACLAIGLGTWAVAAEVKEYSDAVEFFQENGLSVEGLTRGEIKEVYRDITNETFAYSKTALVLQGKTSIRAKGTEIGQDTPDPVEIRLWWAVAQNEEEAGEHYAIHDEEKFDPERGFDVIDAGVLEYWKGTSLTWSTAFGSLRIEDYMVLPDGALVWGSTPAYSSDDGQHSWLARVDREGSAVWQADLLHGFHREYIAKVLENGDGTFAVFSRGDLGSLVLSQISADGRETLTQATEVGNLGIWDAARLSEGYVVHLGNNVEGTDKLVKVSRTGELTDSFTYTAQDCRYYITDMAEFGGKLYLSGYYVPALAEGESSSRYEIEAILQDIFAREVWQIDSQELVEMLRENYTAVLLVCDPVTGDPETFYSVRGSLGGKLNGKGKDLLWDVGSISDGMFSPYTNSFTLRWSCQVFLYTFDSEGNLVSQEKTERVTPYYR